MQDFVIKLVSAIRSKDPVLVEYLVQNNGPIHLDELSKILGMKISEPKAMLVLDQIFHEARNKHFDSIRFPIPSAITQLALLIAASAVISEIIQRIEPILMPAPSGVPDLIELTHPIGSN